jgi:hypothetical protein
MFCPVNPVDLLAKKLGAGAFPFENSVCTHTKMTKFLLVVFALACVVSLSSAGESRRFLAKFRKNSLNHYQYFA